MLVFDNAEGFLIISILKDAILVEETQIFDKVREKKRQMYKLLLHGLDVNFSFIASDAWISGVFFDTLENWCDHQANSFK